MQEFLLYRPYKSQKAAIFCELFIGIISLGMSFLFYPLPFMFILLCSSTIVFFCALQTYESYSLVIAFGQNELQILGKKLLRKYLWSDFSDAYYSANGWGHLYIILSNGELSSEQVWSFRNKASRSDKNICLENTLSIYIGSAFNQNNKDFMQVEEEIKKHKINIHK